MSSPQVKTNSQPQAKTNPNSTNNSTNQTLNWETILKSPRIERQHVDFALSHINDAPVIPYEFVYQFASDVKISYPHSIAISGIGGIIGAILSIKYTDNVTYFVTTEEVINATESSPLFLARYSLEKLSKIYQSEVIILKLNEFEKIKLLIKEGGIYVSGLPYELVIEVAQLAGFGRLWHYSAIQRKFFVF
jgi:hypothetical protein